MESYGTNYIQLNNYSIRTETHQGRKHIVVPVVMLTEGVHNGSHGRILHLAEEFSKFPEAWNGRPVVILHPEKDGRPISANNPDVIDRKTVGRIYNTRFTDNKLKAEVWIDEEKITQISPETLGYIRQNRPLEVSTGLFIEEEKTTGIWNDEECQGIARNYRPDHLALLPGEVGACSWEKGCGIRANQKGVTMNVKKMQEMKQELIIHGLSILVLNQKEGYQEKIDRLHEKLNAMDTDMKVFFLIEVFDKYCIYRVVNSRDHTEEYYEREYKINEDKTIEFISDPISVIRKVEFVKINNLNKKGVMNMADKTKDNKNCCPEEITVLVESKTSGFNEDDREWLQTLSKEAIDKLIAVNNTKDEAVKKAEDAVKEIATLQINKTKKKEETITKEQAIQVLKETISDTKQFMELLPIETREQMEYGLNLHQEKKQELISTITANSDVFGKEELQGKDITELTKLATLVKPVTDYSPMNLQRSDNNEEVLLPTGVKEAKD